MVRWGWLLAWPWRGSVSVYESMWNKTHPNRNDTFHIDLVQEVADHLIAPCAARKTLGIEYLVDFLESDRWHTRGHVSLVYAYGCNRHGAGLGVGLTALISANVRTDDQGSETRGYLPDDTWWRERESECCVLFVLSIKLLYLWECHIVGVLMAHRGRIDGGLDGGIKTSVGSLAPIRTCRITHLT